MDLIFKHFDTIPSTNSWSCANFASFEEGSLTIVTAAEQTAGRGRFGRQWLSTAGNLHASYCFSLKEGTNDPLLYTHLMAHSLAALLQECGLDPKIKWPNDLFISGKKIAGILCETLPLEEGLGVIIGVGLNVNMELKELEDIGQSATSIFLETGKRGSPQELAHRLGLLFKKRLSHCQDKGFDCFLEKMANR